jgi:outer membrane protein assembly factor BamB
MGGAPLKGPCRLDGLEVAWTYPYAPGGFNPIVVDDTCSYRGRNGSLIALDASTENEIWPRGLN